VEVVISVVDEESVRRVADARSFERGQKYFAAGQVRRLAVEGKSVTATVDGTNAYRVRLEIARSKVSGRCSCPHGQEGFFCKHCVAVALAWLDAGGNVGKPRSHPVSDKRLREFLRGQDPAWLADELLTAAQADPWLRARLDVAAGADTQVAYDDRKLRDRLDSAIEISGFVDYGVAYSYFQNVHEALDAVAGLVNAGFPDSARKLAEYALELLEGAAGLVDDSDGGLRDAISRVEEIHLNACAAGAPDQFALAELLVQRALASDLETFLTALPDYEPILGPAGMARYRELVEQAWNALPPRKPGDYSSGRFVITYLTERLAECTGGADALIEVLARDVASSYDILRIAERLCADGRDDEALEWLDRGLKEFPPDDRLRSLAAECHVRAGRQEEAGELLWANFVDHPSLQSYIALQDVLPSSRPRAITLLEAQPSASARFMSMSYGRSTGHSTLVEVLLWEDDSEAAWQAAVHGGCRDELWLRMARERATSHPADAIPILLAAADQAIGHKNRASYRTAAALLTEAETLFERCDRKTDFESHLATIRAEHKPKRALREELDRAGLP
jgi:Family of unknown function (DUF6880)/SWIM zinc finger